MGSHNQAINYGAVNRVDASVEHDALTSTSTSTRTTTKRIPITVCFVALGLIFMIGLAFALVAVAPSSEPELVSAQLLLNGAQSKSTASSVSSSERSTGRDSAALSHDLEDYALIHKVDQRQYYFHDVNEWPHVSLDLELNHEKINGVSREASILSVSWTNGIRGPEKRSVLHDDDVVALRCGTSRSRLRIVGAELLAHIRDGHESKRSLIEQGDIIENTTPLYKARRRTSAWFDGRSSFGEWNVNKDEWVRERVNEKEWNGVNQNKWILDPVPADILVEPHCQAILCHMVEELEYVVVAESALIRFGHIH